MDLISVIIPVYNVEDFLPKCVDSVLNQSYDSLEIILVDDGSTDSSGSICDEYALKDNRIHVIHQPNSGVSAARNAAIDYFHGDYVVFIDGDDFIEPQMIELLHQLLQTNDATFSMVLGRHVSPSQPLNNQRIELAAVKTRSFSQDDMMRGLFGLSDMPLFQFLVVWNKMFPRELVKSTYFIRTGTEDTEYNSRIYPKAGKVVCGLTPMYNWVQRTTSFIHAPMNEAKIDVINSYDIILNTLKDHKRYQAYCLDYMYKVMLNIRYKARGTSFEQQVKKQCKHYKDKTVKQLMRNNTLPFYRRVGLLALYHLPFVYKLIIWKGETAAKRRKR